MTDCNLPPALADKMKLNKPRREKIRMIRRNFILADHSNEILNILFDAHPIAFKTWNAYISLITAAPERPDLYVKHLLELAVEVIRELDPHVHSRNGSLDESEETLKQRQKIVFELRKLAQERTDWPSLISDRENGKVNAKKLCTDLGLGNRVGSKRADAGAPGDVAEQILNKIMEDAKRFPSPRPMQPKHWRFHYVVKEPPPFDSNHASEWEKLVGEVLDHDYGYSQLRDYARRARLRSYRQNLFQIPVGNKSLTATARERQNKRYSSPEFVEDELRKLNQADAEIFGLLPTAETKTNHWHDEPFPCILAHQHVRIFCNRLFRNTRVKGSKGAYNQFKRRVITSVKARLPKPAKN